MITTMGLLGRIRVELITFKNKSKNIFHIKKGKKKQMKLILVMYYIYLFLFFVFIFIMFN